MENAQLTIGSDATLMIMIHMVEKVNLSEIDCELIMDIVQAGVEAALVMQLKEVLSPRGN